MRKFSEYYEETQTILFSCPNILEASQFNQVIDFFNDECRSHLEKINEKTNVKNNLDKYFKERKLHLASDYQFRDVLGFACSSLENNTKCPIDYMYIKNLYSKIRILEFFISSIYSSIGIELPKVKVKKLAQNIIDENRSTDIIYPYQDFSELVLKKKI